MELASTFDTRGWSFLDATDIDVAGRILAFGAKTVRRVETRLPLVLVPIP